MLPNIIILKKKNTNCSKMQMIKIHLYFKITKDCLLVSKDKYMKANIWPPHPWTSYFKIHYMLAHHSTHLQLLKIFTKFIKLQFAES